MTAGRRATVGWLLAVVAMLVFLVTNFRVTTDITEFLPDSGDARRQALVRDIVSGELSRRMILTIEAPTPDAAVQASRDLEAALRADAAWMAAVEDLSGGPKPQSDEALWTLFHPARFGYVATTADAARARASDEALHDAARALKTQLEQPMSALISRVATSDPLLIVPSMFQALAQSQAGKIQLYDQRFVTDDQRFSVLFLTTSARAFDTAAQEPIVDGLTRHFAAVRAASDLPLTLEMSGVNRIAIASKASIERDIQRVSILSTLGLSLLLFGLFRGPRVAGIAVASVGTGVLAGLVATTLVFGRVHGISLAFGASLIGLAVDYVVHVYCHHAEAGSKNGPQATLRRIWPALLMASSTALIGFTVLGFSSFPGLQEVACFAVVGLSVSLATVRWVSVHWIPDTIAPVAWRSGLASVLVRLIRGVQRSRTLVWGLFATVLVVVALGLPTVQWSEDIVDSSTLDADLVAEEARVRDRVSRFDQTRFIVAEGATEEDALQVVDQIDDILRTGDYAEGYSSVGTLLPSAKRQREVAEAFVTSEGLGPRFTAAFEAEGFRIAPFAPFLDALAAPLPDPVRYEDIAASPLADMVALFHAGDATHAMFLSFLSGVHDAEALSEALDAIPGATLVDQSAMVRAATEGKRGRTAALLVVGLALVFSLLWWRYRSIRHAGAVLLPSLLAVALTWSVLALFGYPLDLITLSASLMIVSLGVDYGVFLHDAAENDAQRGGSDERHDGHLEAAMLSVVVAAMTTLLGFGLLAWSSYPLLHRIGLTAAIGITSAMVLAPLALVAFGRGGER